MIAKALSQTAYCILRSENLKDHRDWKMELVAVKVVCLREDGCTISVLEGRCKGRQMDTGYDCLFETPREAYLSFRRTLKGIWLKSQDEHR